MPRHDRVCQINGSTLLSINHRLGPFTVKNALLDGLGFAPAMPVRRNFQVQL